MPLFNILITIILAGFLLWLVNRFIPMDNKIKSILNIVVVIVIIIWLLNVFGTYRFTLKHACLNNSLLNTKSLHQ